METVGVRVVAPHFVAGVELTDGRVTRAAPILKWSMGWDRERLSAYFKSKGWKASVMRPLRAKPICEGCGKPIGPRSHGTCLRAWNGNWNAFFWRTYMQRPSVRRTCGEPSSEPNHDQHG